MAMVCPQCNKAHEQHLNCPDCGGRLLFQANTRAVSATDDPAGDAGQWQQTPWGRMMVGLLIAQGLAYGLQQLLNAGLRATGEQTSVWTTLLGIVLLHSIQGMCLLIGGALTGAGKQRGVLYGSLVGLGNGMIFLLVQRQSGEVLTEIAMYGQPLLHMAFGALGGLIGRSIWKPAPTLLVPDSDVGKSVTLAAPTFQFMAGPVYLGRVCVGVVIVVMGVVWSNAILQWVMTASGGALEIRSHLQAQLIGWEVNALAALFGSGLAGSSTFNGLKQGLFVGAGAALILGGIQLGNPKAVLETTVFMMTGIAVLSVAGGWFGSQLFPPVGAAKRRNRILTD